MREIKVLKESLFLVCLFLVCLLIQGCGLDDVVDEPTVTPKPTATQKPISTLNPTLCNGKGTITYSNSIYVGECKDGRREGKGVLTFNSGGKYDGEWENGIKEGQGTYYYGNSTYIGEWKDGKREGKGVFTFNSGEKYDGEWYNDMKNGQGTIFYEDNSTYIGKWKDGNKDGQGVMTYLWGDKYDGEWYNDKKDGKGKKINQEGICEGIWNNGVLTEITNQDSYEEAYVYFNKIRKQAGLIELEVNGILEESAKNHSNYVVLHSDDWKDQGYINDKGITGHNEEEGKEGYTGFSPADRAIVQGYLTYYGVSEGMTSRCTAKVSINNLMTAIYHRFGILSLGANEIGIGLSKKDNMLIEFIHDTGNANLNNLCRYNSYSTGTFYSNICVNKEYIISVTDYNSAFNDVMKLNPKYVLWPSQDSVNNLYKFTGESPDPMPDYDETGNPISIQFNKYYYPNKITMKSFKLFKKDREIIKIDILMEKTDPNKFFSAYEYALFPLEVLEKNTTYKAEFKYRYNGMNKNIIWSFKTMK
jgi:hypothetical protein